MCMEFILPIMHNRLPESQNELKYIALKRYCKLTAKVTIRELSDMIFTKDINNAVKLKKVPTATQKAILDALEIS